MHSTKNDMPTEVRQKVIGLLNERLADAVDLMTQVKQAHWNVKGLQFQALHALFDDIHADVDGYVDMIAERAVALGGEAKGSARHAAGGSTLAAYPEGLVQGRDHCDALSTALATFGKNVRAAIRTSDEWGDADTADLFTEISRGVDKRLWMVEAHLA